MTLTKILRRLLEAPPALIVVSVIVFGLARLAGGSPIDTLVGPEATAELRERLSQEYGLDQPLPLQYLAWLTHVLRGDLGRSVLTGQPVLTEVAVRFPPTLLLATLAMLLGLAGGLPLGIASARWRDRWPDHLTRIGSSLAMGIPSFVLGLVLILVVGLQLRLLPTSGAPAFGAGFFAALPYYILPVITLGLWRVASISRLFRSTLLDVMNETYLDVARAKGLSERDVLIRHAARNALIPIVTIVAIDYAYLLGGVVIVEAIFGISGVGTLLLSAVARRDFPLIQGVLLAVSVAFVTFNLVADLLYTVIDPRSRGR